MNKNSENGIVIDFNKIGRNIKKRLLLILIILVTCIIGGYCLASFVIPKEYTSSVMFIVNVADSVSEQNGQRMNNSELTASQNLVDTYVVILKSDSVLQDVIKTSSLDNYTTGKLAKEISAGSVNGTQIFKISVQTQSIEDSVKLAEAISTVLPKYANELVLNSSITNVEKPTVPKNKSYPGEFKFAFYGFLVGLFISICIVVLSCLFDQYVRSDKYIIDKYSYTKLGEVPEFVERKN